ncbi:MAG: hypothetical protein FWD23_03100 [Oscillospiraceae bacterium]|nr:hypothetical protein [Oscillospiraceae bacterium]
MKKFVFLLCAVLLSNVFLFGCGNNTNDELESLRAELEHLKSTTNAITITTPEMTSIGESTMETTLEETTEEPTIEMTLEETTEEPVIEENVLFLKNNPIASTNFITCKEQNTKANIFSDISTFIRDLNVKYEKSQYSQGNFSYVSFDSHAMTTYTHKIPIGQYIESITIQKPIKNNFVRNEYTLCFNGNIFVGETIENVINAYGKPTKIDTLNVSNVSLDYIFYDFECFTLNIYHTNNIINTIGISIKEIPALLKLENYLSIYSIVTSKPNNANGVDLSILFSNESDKTIKYMYFYVTPYNAVDDIVFSSIGDKSTVGLELTGPIESGERKSISTQNVWYNPNIKYALLESVKIIYMDGEELILYVG